MNTRCHTTRQGWGLNAYVRPAIAGLLVIAGCSEEDTPVVDPGVFTVESTEPADAETDVAVDREVRVTFSMEIDPATALSAFVIQNADAVAPAGTWIAQGRSAVFTPAMFKPNATYTVTIAKSVGDGTHTLAEDYTFGFTTGATTLLGETPPGAEDSPLGTGLRTINKRPGMSSLGLPKETPSLRAHGFRPDGKSPSTTHKRTPARAPHRTGSPMTAPS